MHILRRTTAGRQGDGIKLGVTKIYTTIANFHPDMAVVTPRSANV